MISAVICVSLLNVWHLCNLPCVYILLILMSIARYAFKFPRICFRRTKCEEAGELNLPRTRLPTCIRILTPGPALIRIVYKYSRLILITDNIFTCRKFFFWDAVDNNPTQWWRNELRNMPHVFVGCLFMSNENLDVLSSTCFLLYFDVCG